MVQTRKEWYFLSDTGYIQVHAYTSNAQIPLKDVSIAITNTDGAAIALRAAEITTYRRHHVYELECSYQNYQKYLFEMSRAGVVEENTEFGELVTLRFVILEEMAEGFLKKICEIANGKEIQRKFDERFC